MGYEGYVECLCSMGHFWTIPEPYYFYPPEEEEVICPYCEQKAIITNSVDDTNCDSVGKLDLSKHLLKKGHTTREKMIIDGVISIVTTTVPDIYRIPSLEEVKQLRTRYDEDTSSYLYLS